MTQPLNIVRLALDRRQLLRLVSRYGSRYSMDEGGSLHAGLSMLFAKSSERAHVPLHTYAVDDTYALGAADQERVFLLGYSDLGEAELLDRMGDAQRSLLHECSSRPVPVLDSGTHCHFRLRATPIVRSRHPGMKERPQRSGRPVSREVDAFLHACWSAEGRTVDREQVYRDWLTQRIANRGGARVVHSDVVSFKRERLARGTHGEDRRMRRCERPDVTFEGHIDVTDPSGFTELLRSGVGRHKAYGFGMLRVRPL